MDRFINILDMAPFCASTEDCLQFLFDEGLLRTEMLCPVCNAVLHPIARRDRTYPEFCCRTGHARVTQSVCKGTWFDKTRLPPAEILLIAYCFAHKLSYNMTIVQSSLGDQQISQRTVSDWFSSCREICMLSMDRKCAQLGKIGGPGHIVQIDECKIGQRTFHRGRITEGSWILAMIDISTNEVRMTICPNNRDAYMLFNLISDYVELGSMIHTDAWGGYYGFMVDRFQTHLSVYHSLDYVDPAKNCIESRWRALRHYLSKAGVRRQNMDVHICEFLWRQDCKNRSADPFQELMEDIQQVYCVV